MLATGAVATAFSGANIIFESFAIVFLNEWDFYSLQLLARVNIAAVILCTIAFALGIVAIKINKKAALASAVCLLVSTVIHFGSMGYPNFVTDPYNIYSNNGEATVMLAISGVCAFICAILFIAYFIKAPTKTEYFKSQSNLQGLLSSLKKLKTLYDESVISEDEYGLKKQKILSPILVTEPDNKAVLMAKNKKLMCAILPVSICLVVLCVTVIGLYFGVCGSIYTQFKNTMSDVQWFGESSNAGRVLNQLPANYRDIDKFREEYLQFEKDRSILKGRFYANGDDVRKAYLFCKNKLEERSDWNWNYEPHIILDYNVIINTKWVNSDFYLEIDDWADVTTNLPMLAVNDSDTEQEVSPESSQLDFDYDNNSLTIRFIYDYYDGNYDGTHNIDMFLVSNYRYDESCANFCIDVLCLKDNSIYTLYLQ